MIKRRTSGRGTIVVQLLVLCGVLTGTGTLTAGAGEQRFPASRVEVPAAKIWNLSLQEGETFELATHIVTPSRLPDNARLRVSWDLVKAEDAASWPPPLMGSANDKATASKGGPTANWSKLLHALDPDVYLVYRAPVSGQYRLTVGPEEGEVDLFEKPRWREPGHAPQSRAVPKAVAWPPSARVEVDVRLSPLDVSGDAAARFFIEAEPNDSPELAQPLKLPATTDNYSAHVTGTADDLEYFDNGDFGERGDDWFRFTFPGPEPRLLAVCLSIPDQTLAAQIRCYTLDAKKNPREPQLSEYLEGRNPNERAHQQSEQHRIAINRLLQPGQVYFLRVEANAPVYDLELRVVKPAPFDDPRQAVRQGLYDHIGQVDAWLANRPRGGSLDRRIRDTGNLLGTNCMSCHTQSGVWGPAIPFAQGYRPQNVLLWRDLVNISYQSLRPTNKLIDAANNTSLSPLDLGDGPAGTRVAGHALVSFERFQKPRKLQAQQALRVANFILQTGDPGGINAAGNGANVGQGVVFNYAGEVLFEAWKATGNPHYFHALEEKAQKLLGVEPKYTDDLCHRVEFFQRYFPADYPAAVAKVTVQEAAEKPPVASVKFPGKRLSTEESTRLWERIQQQVTHDLARIRAIQNADGSWAFHPGTTADGGKSWSSGARDGKDRDPAPTALALIALQAAGFGPEDPAVARGVKALLAMQHPTGYWNAASQTGFVTTSYSLHALSRLYPEVRSEETSGSERKPLATGTAETLIATLRRVREAALSDDPSRIDELVQAAGHAQPLVRMWANIGLGLRHQPAGVPPLVKNLADPVKPVREAAGWGLRQSLIDDLGWEALFTAIDNGTDRTRETAYRALIMKVDGVLTQSAVGWDRLTRALDRGLTQDPHPGVRAWAAKAAWQWWVWNPPTRAALNESWVKLLTCTESNALVENCQRYQTQALFIVNGHKANASQDHQYAELAQLFMRLKEVSRQWNDASTAGGSKEQRAQAQATAERLNRRLVAVAATFFQQSGGDGGPGQMGYSTPGAGRVIGDALLAYLAKIPDTPRDAAELTLLKIGLEGAANVPHEELQEKLVQLSLRGPEETRTLAANSISDPRSAQLVAVPELLEPLLEQIVRGANEPQRRAQLSDPLLKLFARVKWVVPQTVEQQREVYQMLVPKFESYFADDEIAKTTDVAEKQRRQKQRDADWYLAVGLGDALGENADLNLDTTFEFFPRTFRNPLQVRFWLPSVNWMLMYKTKLPDVKVVAGELPPIDPFAEPRSRALRLFLQQLQPEADPRNRELAVKMAQQTALRRNPEVLTALDSLIKFESREPVKKMAQNVLSQGREKFLQQLVAAVKSEQPPRLAAGDGEANALPQAFVDDFVYFRDYVLPEMNRVLRGDQRSCLACHGVPGRVPPLEMHRPDDAGYLPVDKLLANYRLLQDRVDVKDVEKSKLLRKPLNVQTGQEDGHQGGRRYQPTDEGYQILRKWALNQVELQSSSGRK